VIPHVLEENTRRNNACQQTITSFDLSGNIVLSNDSFSRFTQMSAYNKFLEVNLTFVKFLLNRGSSTWFF
jgi:hypothetical protein